MAAGLQRVQGRRAPADQVTRSGMGRARHPGQRDRARLREDGNGPGGPARVPALLDRGHPAAALRAARGNRAQRRVPGQRRRVLHHRVGAGHRRRLHAVLTAGQYSGRHRACSIASSIRVPDSSGATPSATAARAAARATAVAVSTRWAWSGRIVPRWSRWMLAWPLTAVAAAVIIASVTRVARTAVTARPIPGKMYTLLHWATGILASPTFIGGNGEPVATSARPSVQSARSCGLASLRLVGLDSGMMIGRRVCAAIRRTISSVNAPVAVDRPISAVG